MGDRIRAAASLGTSTTGVLCFLYAVGCTLVWSYFGRNSNPSHFGYLLVLWVPCIAGGGAMFGAGAFAIAGGIAELLGVKREFWPAVYAVLGSVLLATIAFGLTRMPDLATHASIGGFLAGAIVGLGLRVHDDTVRLSWAPAR